MQWFAVDRKGLAKLLERKGKEFILFELVQNAWDEQTTTVSVTLDRIAGTRQACLTVKDDNPEGFPNAIFQEAGARAAFVERTRTNIGGLLREGKDISGPTLSSTTRKPGIRR